jgi:hypothetical protein
MKHFDKLLGVLLVAFCTAPPISTVAASGQEAAVAPAKPAANAMMPVYNPPKRGMPGGRLGGGTRGVGQHVTMLSVLAPDHTGLTTQEQPILYWYLSTSTSQPIYFTLIDTESMKTILDVRLPSPARPGVQAIRLTDHNIHLSPGIQYQWFIGLMVDGEHRSKDVIAGGVIERAAAPKELSSKLAGAGRTARAAVYAEAGFWYDAVEAISEEINAVPSDAGLRKQRASLLEQVGLKEIAAYDAGAS